MRDASFSALVLWFTLLPWAGVSHAQQPAGEPFKDEYSRQDNIYRSTGTEVPEGYVINRALDAYRNALPAQFAIDLTALDINGRWLDIGAGEGHAVLDYYGPPALQTPDMNKAQAVAISIEDRRTPLWNETAQRLAPGKIRYLYGKSLNDYTAADLGRFEVITDLLGGFSYSRDITRFMRKTLSFLQVNGSFYTILQDVQSEAGSNLPYYRAKGDPYLTEIIGEDGSKTSVCSWLKHISCVEVSCELRADWKPPVEVYRVRKTCSDTTVPPLALTGFTAGTPPQRFYRPVSPPAPAAAPITETVPLAPDKAAPRP